MLKDFRLGFVALGVGLALSCDSGGCNECAECQSAIDHMQGKIWDNACNPNYMENAVNRIEDDCQDHGPTLKYVGAVYEWCKAIELEQGSGQPQVQCEAPNLTSFAIQYLIDPSYLDTYPNGLLFEVRVDYQFVDDVILPAGTTFLASPIHGVSGDSAFEIAVFTPDDVDRENPIFLGLENLRIRQSSTEWEAPLRTVHLTYTPEGNEDLVLAEF